MNSFANRAHQDDSFEKEDILEFEGEISPDISIPNNQSILIISKDQSFLSHGIHKFPAKFFPELPRYLIRRFSEKGMKVLDPMCGSGTVPLEAMLSGRVGIGLDIDPIARLITNVKTTPLPSLKLRTLIPCLRECIDEKIRSESYSPLIPSFHYRDNWFRDFVLYELGMILDCINETCEHEPSYGPETKNFLRVVFSSIVRDVSNADPHCTRTVIRKKQLRRIHPGETLEIFFESLDKQKQAMLDLLEYCRTNDVSQAHHLMGSSTHIPLSSNSIDLAVTSPPYINAVDYTRTHQLEMYWLGMLDDTPLSQRKRKYIGTETVYKEEYEDLRTSGYETLDSLLHSIHQKDPRRSFIIFKFFEDMKAQLLSTRRVLKPGGRYCIAIGNNTIRGHEVESHKILSEIAKSEEIGFDLERKFFSLLIRHFIKIPRPERMDGEWVLILRKPE